DDVLPMIDHDTPGPLRLLAQRFEPAGPPAAAERERVRQPSPAHDGAGRGQRTRERIAGRQLERLADVAHPEGAERAFVPAHHGLAEGTTLRVAPTEHALRLDRARVLGAGHETCGL